MSKMKINNPLITNNKIVIKRINKIKKTLKKTMLLKLKTLLKTLIKGRNNLKRR